MSIRIFLQHELTNVDLQDLALHESLINSGALNDIDFLVVCDPEYGFVHLHTLHNNPLWKFLRNLGYWVLDDSTDWKYCKFRGEDKFVMLVWH